MSCLLGFKLRFTHLLGIMWSILSQSPSIASKFFFTFSAQTQVSAHPLVPSTTLVKACIFRKAIDVSIKYIWTNEVIEQPTKAASCWQPLPDVLSISALFPPLCVPTKNYMDRITLLPTSIFPPKQHTHTHTCTRRQCMHRVASHSCGWWEWGI